MGVNVDVINEIYTRIAAAIGQGGELLGVRRVRVGAIEESRKENDLPIINIQFTGGSESADFQNIQRSDTMHIDVTLIHEKYIGDDSSFYDIENQIGALYMFEALRNVIDKNTEGMPDNTFNSKVEYDKLASYDITDDQGVYVFTLRLELKTKSYAAGAR